MKITSICEEINKVEGKKLVFLSCGRDSAVMLDLLYNACDLQQFYFIHFWFFDAEYKAKYLDMKEEKYKIKIDRFPHWEENKLNPYRLKKKAKAIKNTQNELYYKKLYNVDWVLTGIRSDESLARRGMINKYGVIDYQNGRMYPIAHFKRKTVEKYVKFNKIFLSPEYEHGFRDIEIHLGNGLQWLRNTYPRDFQRFIKKYPLAEATLL